MDIDTPSAPTADPGSFALVFPLPFRILSLVSLGILAWATNLHGTAATGVDTVHVLDVRAGDEHDQSPLPRVSPSPTTPTPRRNSASLNASLYSSVYKLGAVLSLWTSVGWIIFRYLTVADPALVRQYSLLPFVWLLSSIIFLASPQHHFFKRERWMARQCLRRTALGSMTDAVPFSDVLFADIMTSFAKVFGDLWVSACLIVVAEHGLASQLDRVGCYKELMVPVLTSLPYVFRLRQCLAEYFGKHTATPRRSLLNALKYATAFPVIILSAMQTVYGDPYDDHSKASAHFTADSDNNGFGRYALFQIWIVAVVINSLYSFWWDVTNDWGLSLLKLNGITSAGKHGSGSIRLPSSRSVSRSRSSEANHKSSSGHSASWISSPEVLHQQHRSRGHSIQLHLPDTPDLDHDVQSQTFPPQPLTVPSTKLSNHQHNRKKSLFNLPFTQDPPFLRSALLLPDPVIYYLVIAIDLVLRLTWSLKLSSHLHSVHELESGVFGMEALELLRRWMWVFVRIEWEAVKRGASGSVGFEDVTSSMLTSPESDGGFERSGLGGSSYLRVVDESTGKVVTTSNTKHKSKESDYESDSSLVIISRDRDMV